MSRARSVLLGLASGCRVVSGRRFVVGLAASVGVVAAAAVFRWVRSWRLLVRRLFALASVWGVKTLNKTLHKSDKTLNERKTEP